jgi:predicted N-acetyltransferase YhbS
MTIRPATHDDLPAILELSRLSLGSLEGMRTEEYWRWKHIENPFGESPVLLAEEEGKLIGLRAFMQWRFRYQGNTFQAYRAVDTATHPEHQGKGIFTKLTLALIDTLAKGEPSVIFNTPNAKSMPGYLKMGWTVAGKTRLLVKPVPLCLVINRIRKRSVVNTPGMLNFPEGMQDLLNRWMQEHKELVLTDYSEEYLRWRYGRRPELNYALKHAERSGSEAMIIARVKQSGRVRELRLVDVIHAGAGARKLIREALQELVKEHQPDVITALGDAQGELKRLLPFGFINRSGHGLTITCRKVNDEALTTLAQQQEHWFPSAGTLELF